jgi:hypothetical protein
VNCRKNSHERKEKEIVKLGVIAVIVFGTVLRVMADFAEGFLEAKKLFEQEDYQAAHQSFAKVATEAPNDRGRGSCLSWAAFRCR